jgi:hypothetical protein
MGGPSKEGTPELFRVTQCIQTYVPECVPCGMVRVLCNYPTLPLSLDVKVGESTEKTHIVL